MQAQLKPKDWRGTVRVFFGVVGMDDRQQSGVAWIRLGETEKRSSRRLKQSWRSKDS